jgi:ATP-binding cassette subfamily F protein uup
MAAPILSLKDVRLADGQRPLFEGVDLGLELRGRACLVGRNGAGKSTLLRILAGLVTPDSGERVFTTGSSVGMVPQEPLIEGATLLDYACAGGAEAYLAESELQAFGLDPQKSTEGLSGGEIRRAALSRALAEQPDVLLLDEPTNHLDIFAIQTLESRILASRASILTISHDRAFLERITQTCFWLEGRQVRKLQANFSQFDEWADKILADEAESFRKLTKAIERETYWLGRSVTARRTRNEGRAGRLREMRSQRSAIMRDQGRSLDMSIDSGTLSGRKVIEAKDISKTFSGPTLFKGFSTRVLRGDRVAIVGPNGAGKSTLINVLLGNIAPDAGTVTLGTGLEIAYVDQTRAHLKPDQTLWDIMAPAGGDQIIVRGTPKHVAAYAKDFLFQESQLRQPVRSLSGGERNRLLLAVALAKPANLLILDEPTNDLDMETLDLLEDVLEAFEGTLLLVSHDRDFIDRLATSTIALDGQGQVIETPGGWSDFLTQNPDFLAPPKASAAKAPVTKAAPERIQNKAAKLSYKDQRRLEELENLIETLPTLISRTEVELEDPNLFSRDPKRFEVTLKKVTDYREQLAQSEEEWFLLQERLEALRSPS